jgi:Ca-activated chloride channel homolog
MNRTKAILIVGALLALGAALLARGTTTGTEPPVSSGNGTISIGASPSNRYVLVGGSREIFLDISLAAAAGRLPRQLPINLAVVIDRSGSMAGQKLEHAREAARTVISKLRDGDRIALVTFGSDVTVLFPSTLVSAETRPSLLAAIDNIVDRGGTFLSGGLESGREQVLRHARQGFVNRVLLMSDGQANEGVTGPMELAGLARAALGQGIHVSTMGLGTDFNEDVMTSLAENGGGRYYFVADSSAMASMFNDELKTLLATVGRDATLKLTLEPGIELLEVYGYTFQQNGNEVKVDLPDLYSGQNQKLIAKVRVPTDHEGKVAVGRVELNYLDAATNRRAAVESRVVVELTGDSRKFDEGQDRNVLARAEQAAAAKRLSEAMDAYGRGEVSRSQALLQAQIDATARANQKLQNKDLDALVGTMRARLSGTAAAPPSSEAGKSLIKRGKFEAYQLAK